MFLDQKNLFKSDEVMNSFWFSPILSKKNDVSSCLLNDLWDRSLSLGPAQRWRTVGNTVSDLSSLRFPPKVTPRVRDEYATGYALHVLIINYNFWRDRQIRAGMLKVGSVYEFVKSIRIYLNFLHLRCNISNRKISLNEQFFFFLLSSYFTCSGDGIDNYRL